MVTGGRAVSSWEGHESASRRWGREARATGFMPAVRRTALAHVDESNGAGAVTQERQHALVHSKGTHHVHSTLRAPFPSHFLSLVLVFPLIRLLVFTAISSAHLLTYSPMHVRATFAQGPSRSSAVV